MSGEHGIDVSHHQGHINWHMVAASGIRFAYAKCTEAAGNHLYVDEQFETNQAGAHAANIAFGAYHFGRPSCDPALSARQFLSTAGWMLGDLPPVLDLETTDGYSAGHCKTWARRFFAALAVPGMVYTGHWFWTTNVTASPDPVFTPMPLWLGPDHPQPPCWTGHTVAQTYGGTVPGVTGPCDLDVIKRGSLADLISYAAGNHTPVTPKPASDEKEPWDMADYTIVFVTYNNSIYEASLLTGTYYKVPNPLALENRQAALTHAGIKYRSAGKVTGLDRYGIQLKRALL